MTDQPTDPHPTTQEWDRAVTSQSTDATPATTPEPHDGLISSTVQERLEAARAAVAWARAQAGQPYAAGANVGPVVVDTRMTNPGAPDWGGEHSPEGAQLYHHAWHSTDGEVNLWVGPYEASANGWAVCLAASETADIVLRCAPDQIVQWATNIIAAVDQSRDEIREAAGEDETAPAGPDTPGVANPAPGATTRARIAEDLRMLAAGRGEYCHSCPESEADLRAMNPLELAVHTEHETADRLADIIEGTNNAKGWLPSWRWGEWIRR